MVFTEKQRLAIASFRKKFKTEMTSAPVDTTPKVTSLSKEQLRKIEEIRLQRFPS